jgi:thiamine biosynthesis lipoprotein
MLSACGNGDSMESFGGPTMGSTYSIKYVRRAGLPAPADVRVEVEKILTEIDRQMSTYRSDSDISRFNDLPANRCQKMPASILKLIRVGEQLSEQSEGSYDLTVEPLLNLWGFGPQGREEKVPAEQALAQARQRVGYQHLRIEGDQLCKDAAVEVDFNSIAAGYAVDTIAARLEALGIHDYLAEATGELKAAGKKLDGSPWHIALEEPRDDQQVAERIVAVDGLGLSTGAPITHALASVTVIHPSALMADGLSTLLLILGPERGWDYAEKHDIGAFFVIRADTGFVTRTSHAFERITGGKTE